MYYVIEISHTQSESNLWSYYRTVSCEEEANKYDGFIDPDGWEYRIAKNCKKTIFYPKTIWVVYDSYPYEKDMNFRYFYEEPDALAEFNKRRDDGIYGMMEEVTIR